MAEMPLVAEGRNPEGRIVHLTASTWNHVLQEHPEMAEHLEDLMVTIAQPDHREPDSRPGRERYFSTAGPQGWIRVVTRMADDIDLVVTAFPQQNDPRTSGSR